jgi:hypothetical protein
MGNIKDAILEKKDKPQGLFNNYEPNRISFYLVLLQAGRLDKLFETLLGDINNPVADYVRILLEGTKKKKDRSIKDPLDELKKRFIKDMEKYKIDKDQETLF